MSPVLVNNNAGPPPGIFEDWSYEDWMEGIAANIIAPIMMIKGVIWGMEARKWDRIINITSAMVKASSPRLGLSTDARAELTALSKSLSRRVACKNVTINNLLSERIDTPRQVYMAVQRMGSTEEFGAACEFFNLDIYLAKTCSWMAERIQVYSNCI